MEQIISNLHKSQSSLHKSLTKLRKRERNYPLVQSLQATSSPGKNLLNLGSIDSGKQIHAHVIKSGEKWISEPLTYNLIQLCLECGDTQSASMLFLTGLDKGSISLSNLADTFDEGRGHIRDFVRILHELQRTSGIVSNAKVLIAALKISQKLVDLWLGLQIHALVVKYGQDVDTLLKCSLLDFYADCVSMESTGKLFEEVPIKCDVLWNKVVTLNVEKELWSKALDLFREMQSLSVKADEVTIAKVLNSCGRVEALMLGKEIHGHVLE